jgi:hypothetical protein
LPSGSPRGSIGTNTTGNVSTGGGGIQSGGAWGYTDGRSGGESQINNGPVTITGGSRGDLISPQVARNIAAAKAASANAATGVNSRTTAERDSDYGGSGGAVGTINGRTGETRTSISNGVALTGNFGRTRTGGVSSGPASYGQRDVTSRTPSSFTDSSRKGNNLSTNFGSRSANATVAPNLQYTPKGQNSVTQNKSNRLSAPTRTGFEGSPEMGGSRADPRQTSSFPGRPAAIGRNEWNVPELQRQTANLNDRSNSILSNRHQVAEREGYQDSGVQTANAMARQAAIAAANTGYSYWGDRNQQNVPNTLRSTVVQAPRNSLVDSPELGGRYAPESRFTGRIDSNPAMAGSPEVGGRSRLGIASLPSNIGGRYTGEPDIGRTTLSSTDPNAGIMSLSERIAATNPTMPGVAHSFRYNPGEYAPHIIGAGLRDQYNGVDFGDLSDQEIGDLYARTVYAEAANQGPLGQMAAANVINNRLRAAQTGLAIPGNKLGTFRDILGGFDANGIAANRVSANPVFNKTVQGTPGYAQAMNIAASGISPNMGLRQAASNPGVAAEIASYFGKGLTPSSVQKIAGATHYYANNPSWGKNLTDRAKFGAHTFGTEPSWSQADRADIAQYQGGYQGSPVSVASTTRSLTPAKTPPGSTSDEGSYIQRHLESRFRTPMGDDSSVEEGSDFPTFGPLEPGQLDPVPGPQPDHRMDPRNPWGPIPKEAVPGLESKVDSGVQTARTLMNSPWYGAVAQRNDDAFSLKNNFRDPGREVEMIPQRSYFTSGIGGNMSPGPVDPGQAWLDAMRSGLFFS